MSDRELRLDDRDADQGGPGRFTDRGSARCRTAAAWGKARSAAPSGAQSKAGVKILYTIAKYGLSLTIRASPPSAPAARQRRESARCEKLPEASRADPPPANTHRPGGGSRMRPMPHLRPSAFILARARSRRTGRSRRRSGYSASTFLCYLIAIRFALKSAGRDAAAWR